MVTLKGKEAERFIKKMISKEKKPISKKDKKLAKEVIENMSKLKVVESDDDKRRRELEEKYNPTIKKVDDGICSRCRKNKATINYTDSIMCYTHGFIENICQECYDKMKHKNTWYKEGKKETLDKVKKLIRKERKNWITATDWDKNILNGIKKIEDEKPYNN